MVVNTNNQDDQANFQGSLDLIPGQRSPDKKRIKGMEEKKKRQKENKSKGS